ncbi:MAG TPA: DUF58 domain-containing protein, partial [Candidatus Margulisiibacteriota bacterium]|nr:DUF58 domain-containing protein [Candidatus Margulisiibacteriota bacterium]
MLKVLFKRWLFLILIAAFSLVISLRTAIPFFYYLFWLILSLVLLSFSFLLLEYSFVNLTLTRKMDSRIEEDDLLEVEASLLNNGWLPAFNLLIEDNIGPAMPQERRKLILLEYLPSGGSVKLNYSCLCFLRGHYFAGPFSVYFFDPCGLFFLKKRFDVRSEIYVMPKVFKVHKFPVLLKGTLPWFGIGTKRVSGDEDDFFGIRDYKDGDPIKRIHWFSSARMNKLIVKEYQCRSYSRATILFNLDIENNFGEGKDTVAEYTIKIAASVAKYLINSDVSVELIGHAQQLLHVPFNKGQEHLENILRTLAVAKVESKMKLGEVFEEFARYIPEDSNLIVIMADKDWEYLPA